jgi:hypothetical protein
LRVQQLILEVHLALVGTLGTLLRGVATLIASLGVANLLS